MPLSRLLQVRQLDEKPRVKYRQISPRSNQIWRRKWQLDEHQRKQKQWRPPSSVNALMELVQRARQPAVHASADGLAHTVTLRPQKRHCRM